MWIYTLLSNHMKGNIICEENILYFKQWETYKRGEDDKTHIVKLTYFASVKI